jgi:PAS domain S-box-containing protein
VSPLSQPLSQPPRELSLDAFVDTVFLIDIEGRFTLLSPAAESLLGEKLAALDGRHLRDFIAEPYRPALVELMAAIRQGRDPGPYDCELLRGEEQVPVELALRARREGNRIVAYQGQLREAWNIRSKSDKLLEQKRRFAVLAEIGHGMQSAKNLDTLYRSTLGHLRALARQDDGAVYEIKSDKSIRRMAWQGDKSLFPEELGLDGSGRALLPETYMFRPQLVDSNNVVSRLGILEHLRAKGRAGSLLLPMTVQGKLNGLVILCARSPKPLDSGLKVLLTQLGAQLGQTRESRILRQQMGEMRIRFDDVSESSVDHIWEVDREGRYVYNSGGAELLLGIKPKELIGRRPVEFIHPDDREQAGATLAELQREGKPVQDLVHRLMTTEGKQIYVETRAFPIYDKRGEMRGYRGVDRDITDWFESKRKMDETLIGTCEALSRMVELRDPYTKGHSVRVAKLAVFLGKHMGRTPYELQGLQLMGLLHDIGKVGIPTEILSKPGRLSSEEMELMRQHPEMSYQILKDISFPWPIADVVRHHHERLDGTGYPDGLEGEELPWQVRLMSVADLLEAMATDRPYRPGLGLERAIQELKLNQGLLYDPKIVELVVKLAEGSELQELLTGCDRCETETEVEGEIDESIVRGIIEEELGRKPEEHPEFELLDL